MRIISFTLLLCFSSGALCSEKDPLIFGPEFTFWVGIEKIKRNIGYYNTLRGQAFKKVTDRMGSHLVLNQPKGFEFVDEPNVYKGEIRAPYKFTSPEGWNFTVETDPAVLEVKMDPMTVKDWEKFADNIQDAVFVSNYNEGYFPSDFGGGGHINLDAKWFLNRPMLFRNFIVDIINHNELSLGILGFDTNNALSISMLPSETWRDILWVIDVFDNSEKQFKDAQQLRKELDEIIRSSNDPLAIYWDSDAKQRDKFNEIKLVSSSGSERIELRSARAQKDIYTWIKQIRLLENRIKYLSKFKHPIPVEPLLEVPRLDQFPSDKELQDNIALNPPTSAQEALRAFHQYVTEAGEKWEDHQDYLWPQWITDGELDRFNETLECSQYLEAQ